MIAFEVDDVVPASTALPTRPLRESFPDALAIGGDPGLPVLTLTGTAEDWRRIRARVDAIATGRIRCSTCPSTSRGT
jgi:hypothetical protein